MSYETKGEAVHRQSLADKLLVAFMQRKILSTMEIKAHGGGDARARMNDLRKRGFLIVHLKDRTETVAVPETGGETTIHYYEFRGRKPVSETQNIMPFGQKVIDY